MLNENTFVKMALSENFVRVLPLVVERLSPLEVLQLRVVSKEWAQIIGASRPLQKLTFTVSNTDSMVAFRTLSPSLKVKHFRFETVDMEGWLFGDPEVFQRFALDHCPNLTELYMSNCSLPAGRFLEILAFCRNLRDLGIRFCPSVFQTDLSIMHWGFCFNSVRLNLAGVTRLQVTETILSEVNLWGLAAEMKSLKEVNIGSVENTLPRFSIINILKNNCATLTDLSLYGKLFDRISEGEEYLKMQDLPEMKALTTIRITRGQFDSTEHSQFLERLFGRCPNLKRLFLGRCTLERTTLSGVANQLEDFRMGGCSCTSGTFKDMDFPKLKNLKVVQQTGEMSTATKESVIVLLQGKKLKLETLELVLNSDGGNYLKALFPSKCPKLITISLMNCTTIGGPGELKQFLKKFKKLKSLTLKNCVDLEDKHICSASTATGGEGMAESLGNLTNLEFLDLSGTGIGNQTITECVSQMKKLKQLLIDGTNVDREGLKYILEAATSQLPSLAKISLDDSKCKITRAELGTLAEIAPRVEINYSTTS